MAGTGWFRLGMLCGLLVLAGCIPSPPQPDVSGPYALLEFPRTMRLVALNGSAIDDRLLLRGLRVPPGRHTLQFVYTAQGAEGSRQHDGQRSAPFPLETQSGRTYIFEAKTWGVVWRPEVATEKVIAGYCTTHTCTDNDASTAQRATASDCP